MGLTISDWGPSAWNTLHVICHTYPKKPTKEHKKQTYEFLHLFASHLPCPSCREHFMDLLAEEIPSTDSEHFDSRENMVEFMNDMHNIVNRRLGKRVFTLSEHYDVYRPRPKGPSINLVHVTIFVVIICAVSAFCRHRKQRGVRC
jgi:hypothetical protein